MKRKRALPLLFALASLSGLAMFVRFRVAEEERIRFAFPPEIQGVVAKCDKMYIYSLQAERLPDSELKALPNFHRYPILGQTRVRPSPERSELFAAIRGNLGRLPEPACFQPHYGLRAVRGGKTVDLLVAFRCANMRIYDERGVHTTTVTPASVQAFNRILAEYDIPLPEH